MGPLFTSVLERDLPITDRRSRVPGFLLNFQAGITYYVSRPVAYQPRGVVSNALLFLALQTPSSISV